jgi:membrane protease YdiL (CAAX protease family)
MHSLFVGSDGLRPVWRVVSYFAMYGALYFLLGILLYYLNARGVGRLRLGMLAELGLFLAAAIPAFVMARVENRTWDSYGLPRSHAFGKLFWVGTLWGMAALTILMLALHGVGVFDFGRPVLHGTRILKFAAYWAVFFLLVGFFEEFLLRGYSQVTLAQGIGFWPSAAVLSFLFSLLHFNNPGETVPGLIAVLLIGFFFCLTLRRTGNLWFAVGFHASWDWGETFLYSVPDSGGVSPGHLLNSSLHGSPWLTGGSAGPEGSLFVFVTLALLWTAFDRAYPEVKYRSADVSPAVGRASRPPQT